MKIYFAGSIRGGREDQGLYASMIEALQAYGTVLTEHLGSKELTGDGEITRTDKDIFVRDMAWVEEADVIVAEVTTPSLGVGYEIGRAEAMGKPILCLSRNVEGKRLSAMVAGNEYVTVAKFENLADLKNIFEEFFVS